MLRHHFEVLEIPPDVVLELPWLPSYNPIVYWRERYAYVRQGPTLYRLFFDGSRGSTRLQFQPTFNLELLSIEYLENSSTGEPNISCPGTPEPETIDRRKKQR